MPASALQSSILLLQATGGDYLGLTGPYMGYVVSSGTVTDAKSYSVYQTQVCNIFSKTVLLTRRSATDPACRLCSMYMLWLNFCHFTCILRADQEVTRITKAIPVRLNHLRLAFVGFACHVYVTRHLLILGDTHKLQCKCSPKTCGLQVKTFITDTGSLPATATTTQQTETAAITQVYTDLMALTVSQPTLATKYAYVSDILAGLEYLQTLQYDAADTAVSSTSSLATGTPTMLKLYNDLYA